MIFSLSPLSLSSLKAEARALREEASSKGRAMTQAEALEAVAREHGFRDWNTARAGVPDRLHCPVEIGQRVSGTYLKQPFTGKVLAAAILADSEFFRVTILFDEPVDVIRFEGWSSFRKRVSAVINVYGVSLERTSDGEPHLKIERKSGAAS